MSCEFTLYLKGNERRFSAVNAAAEVVFGVGHFGFELNEAHEQMRHIFPRAG